MFPDHTGVHPDPDHPDGQAEPQSAPGPFLSTELPLPPPPSMWPVVGVILFFLLLYGLVIAVAISIIGVAGAATIPAAARAESHNCKPAATSPATFTVSAPDALTPHLLPFAAYLPLASSYASVADEHYQWCRSRLALEHDRPAFAEYARHALSVAEAWSCLAHAADHESQFTAEDRADYLDELHELLGDDDFAAGWMPPPVPFLPLWTY